ncbi:DUF4302 domain-containing protein [Chitinophaga sp. G-6-1-13]|uniref:DUF4302 domain-containing protein n=1 Tax=Chitinophaga fulva TaxID=2728842 RepID=A0A848GRR9_9BACT|nr:DUF4302 domain-containing protein [Chitinophaga fulva]NML41276.1 DUF4302 domain-containing protein [Chitinophaga fulva]
MKKLALYTLLCAAVLASCRKNNALDIPVEKSYTEPKQQLDSFKTVLGSAPNGWVGVLTPREGKELYNVYLQLDNSKSEVTLYTDINATTAATPSKSRFSLSISQTVNPTLNFSEGSQLGDIKLSNRGVDTAYAFRYISGDTLVLTGNKFSDELKLVKASAQVKADYAAGNLQASMAASATFFNQPGFFAIKPGNTPAFVFFNTNSKIGGFAFVNNKTRTSSGTGYAYTLTGITLRHPVVVDNQSVSSLIWDATVSNFYALVDKNKVYLERTNVPIVPVHYLLGSELPGALTMLPPTTYPLPGWTADFMTIWNDVSNRFKGAKYPITKVVMDFQTVNNLLNMDIYIGTIICRYSFRYTKTADGVYSFVMLAFTNDTPGANGNALKTLAQPLTNMLSTNRFTLDYLDAPDGVFVSFKSADKPTLGFTSYW